MELRRGIVCTSLAISLLASTAFSQRVVSVGPSRKQEVIFIFTKNEESSFPLARLTEAKMTLSRSESDLSYASTPVALDDTHAVCRFEGVIPGDHKLELSVFKLKTHLRVPEKTSGKVTYEVSIGRAISIRESSEVAAK